MILKKNSKLLWEGVIDKVGMKYLLLARIEKNCRIFCKNLDLPHIGNFSFLPPPFSNFKPHML